MVSMEPTIDLPHVHRKTLHSKRSFGKARVQDSPAYDASEEDNDPLTDDGSIASIPTRTAAINAMKASSNSTGRKNKHHLAASVVSDSDGVDSPTYDGDIESSTTIPSQYSPTSQTHQHSTSISTINSPGTPTLTHEGPTPSEERSNKTFLSIPSPSSDDSAVSYQTGPGTTSEPSPAEISKAAFNPAALTTEDIQEFVQTAINGESWRKYKINKPPTDRPIRVYADGVYDLFHFGHALQLRQAKLSFPSVYLLVGVNSDKQVRAHKAQGIMNHAERLEAVRHCRWVDEVVSEAPWVINKEFIDKYQIDYVAHDEDPYAADGHEDVYQFVKQQGRFIPTRRTPGVSTSELLERIVSGYRRRDFDAKLTKMGHSELKAEGSDYDEMSLSSRSVSRNLSPIPR